jgi:antitoxin component HigA of HigAB toxin-antitoxin module
MVKIFENKTEITSEKEYKIVMKTMKLLINEATQNGLLAQQNADNENTREIGRLSNLCANYEDNKMEFENIVVRGHSPLVRALQEEMHKRDFKQKDIARIIGVNDAVFSLFMNGKRSLSMNSARKLYKKLNIDPKLILEYA